MAKLLCWLFGHKKGYLNGVRMTVGADLVRGSCSRCGWMIDDELTMQRWRNDWAKQETKGEL